MIVKSQIRSSFRSSLIRPARVVGPRSNIHEYRSTWISHSVASRARLAHLAHLEGRTHLLRAPSASAVAEAPQAAQEQPYAGKKAVVIGAGPAGSTAAMTLARQGFKVDVFERRPAPKDDAVDTGRAYIIFLIPRGQAALQNLGISMPTDEKYKSLGSVRHSPKGEVRVTKESTNVSFSRNDLAQWLIDEASSRYPSQITFYFNAMTKDIDLAQKQASFENEGVRDFDLLVGADGSGSAVRGALQQQTDMTFDIDDSGREYKVYMGVRADLEPPEFKGQKGTTLHLFTSTDAFTTVTAHANPDGTYSGTFSMKSGEHDTFTTQEAYEALLKDKFKGLPDHWIPEIAKQALRNPARPAGKRIKCSQIHGPNAVILGDAAHAVTPVFGQGANSALESCRALEDVLKAAVDPVTKKGKVEEVPAAFSQRRLPDAHALFWIDSAAYSFFAKKPGMEFFALLAHVLLGTVLSKVVPFLYGPKPALLSLGSPETPYSTIYSTVNRDALAFTAALLALFALITCKALHFI